MMKPDEMIAVIQAFKKGKTIQCATLRGDGTDLWVDAEPSWQFDSMKYRVKPEPKTVFAVFTDGGELCGSWMTESMARSFADRCSPPLNCRVVRMREVL